MDRAKQRVLERKRRAVRVRESVFGSSIRPRLCINRSIKHISAQIFDDEARKSVVQIASYGKEVSEKVSAKGKASKTDVARMVGEVIAAKAKERGIETVVFDRKGYLYHGRVKALADGARAGGLVF
jgi:large subunit ribosomal protein L18